MKFFQYRFQLIPSFICVAVLCAGCAAPGVIVAPQQVVKSFAEDLPQDCSPESRAEVLARAHAGDMRAQHLRGMQYYLHACGDDDSDAAIRYLSMSAAQFYPPSMFHLAANLEIKGGARDRTVLALYRGAAERGFQKAELNVVGYYGNKESAEYNRPEAYAWISYCAQHDSFCSDPWMMSQVMTGMSERDKAKGEKLKAQLVEKMKTVPRVNDVRCCIGSMSDSMPRRE